jgi:hypothetical protein
MLRCQDGVPIISPKIATLAIYMRPKVSKIRACDAVYASSAKRFDSEPAEHAMHLGGVVSMMVMDLMRKGVSRCRYAKEIDATVSDM